jgi:hypothetical protein
MTLNEVKKPQGELTASDSPEVLRGSWRVTGWYGADGNYYERLVSQNGKVERWYRLVS